VLHYGNGIYGLQQKTVAGFVETIMKLRVPSHAVIS